MSLYDEYDQPVLEKRANELIIFSDGVGTMWNSIGDDGNFEITSEEAFSGKYSIKLSWNKGEQDWIGFGNSFSNWGAFDMSEERFKRALSFYVKTNGKPVGGIPIVAALEDMTGGGSYHFVDTKKYMNGLRIDSTWKRIIVPFWDFPSDPEEIDLFSIRQMQFQLEGSGNYYIDEIKIIDYTKEEYNQMRAEVEDMKPKGNPNQIIYTEGKLATATWGTGNQDCINLIELNEEGNTFISWIYESEKCVWSKWGINWNNWYQINFKGIADKSKLMFKVKLKNDSKFKIGIEDFSGHSAEINSSSFNLIQNEWSTVEIPLSQFDLEKKEMVLNNIKQLLFIGEGNGEVLLDDIRIVEI